MVIQFFKEFVRKNRIVKERSLKLIERERKDTATALFCSCLRKLQKAYLEQNNVQIIPRDQYTKLVQEAASMLEVRFHDESSVNECRRELHLEFEDQIIDLFQTFKGADTWLQSVGKECRYRSIFEEELLKLDLTQIQSPSPVEKRNAYALSEIQRNEDVFRERNVIRGKYIKDYLGYNVTAFPSTLENAGIGLFVQGEASVGSIVGFIPGSIWLNEHLRSSAALSAMKDDPNHQLTSRFDGIVVDARSFDNENYKLSYSCPLTRYENPWAVGHLVNHPKKGIEPNCISIMINFSDNLEQDVRPFVPNTFHKPPSLLGTGAIDFEIFMYGMALISTRDIRNEELFVDYRLRAEFAPEWYHPCPVQN